MTSMRTYIVALENREQEWGSVTVQTAKVAKGRTPYEAALSVAEVDAIRRELGISFDETQDLGTLVGQFADANATLIVKEVDLTMV